MSTTSHAPSATRIDPRGPQFNAAVTLVILIAILATAGSWVATALTALQTVLFAIGAIAGPAKTPHSFIFRTLIRPRLSAPKELEDPAPPQFAQAVGLVFLAVALIAFLAGAEVLALVAIGFAVIAATLNAVFRFCLGCELYLLIKRFTGRRPAAV